MNFGFIRRMFRPEQQPPKKAQCAATTVERIERAADRLEHSADAFVQMIADMRGERRTKKRKRSTRPQ